MISVGRIASQLSGFETSVHAHSPMTARRRPTLRKKLPSRQLLVIVLSLFILLKTEKLLRQYGTVEEQWVKL